MVDWYLSYPFASLEASHKNLNHQKVMATGYGSHSIDMLA